MNETVAALYNFTDFFSGECCWFIPVQPPQCVNPALFLLLRITIPIMHTQSPSLLCDFINMYSSSGISQVLMWNPV